MPSIVGIDRVSYSYYRHKPAAERAVMDSALPLSILRATKFHEFLDTLLGGLEECPESPVERCLRTYWINPSQVSRSLSD